MVDFDYIRFIIALVSKYDFSFFTGYQLTDDPGFLAIFVSKVSLIIEYFFWRHHYKKPTACFGWVSWKKFEILNLIVYDIHTSDYGQSIDLEIYLFFLNLCQIVSVAFDSKSSNISWAMALVLSH